MWVALSHRIGFCSLTILGGLCTCRAPLLSCLSRAQVEWERIRAEVHTAQHSLCFISTVLWVAHHTLLPTKTWSSENHEPNSSFQVVLFRCLSWWQTHLDILNANRRHVEWSASRCLLGVDACRFSNAERASSELIWSNTLSSVGTHSHDKGAGNTCAYQTTAMAAAVGSLGLHTVQDPWFLQLISSHISVISLALFYDEFISFSLLGGKV